jgi:histidine phosphotransferase ChpT
VEDLPHHPPGTDADADADDLAPDLAALVGSRICHDLTNPLGAIGNGLELLELSGQTAGPETALIAQSVGQAKARVQFLRIAFGAAPPGNRIAGADLLAVVNDHARGARARIDWPRLGEIERAEAKLAFLLLMCLEAALPFGGEITVAREDGNWRFDAGAERLRDLGALWDTVAGRAPATGIGPPLVQFALAPDIARRLGRPVAVETAPGRIALGF